MLKIEEVRFGYGNGWVLDGIDLSVGGGELVGVVGPNGAGKTTLFRLLSGVRSPSEGRVYVNGQDTASLSQAAAARLVSVAPQNPNLPASFTVMDLVLMARNPYLNLLQWEGRGDVEKVERAMEATDTLALADRPMRELSGGERQRALIAMSLAQDAPVMLLDEPTSNLDLAHQARVMDLVVDLARKRSAAVLVAMHDLSLASQYCDRLIMLADGKIFDQGSPGEVLTAENISAVYGVDVVTLFHPETGAPVVLPASSSNLSLSTAHAASGRRTGCG